MAKYRKRPVVVEAVRWTGSRFDTNDGDPPEWLHFPALEDGESVQVGDAVMTGGVVPNLLIRIHTLEGEMVTSPGDWIIRGVKGEIYPCKPDIFAATYEPAE